MAHPWELNAASESACEIDFGCDGCACMHVCTCSSRQQTCVACSSRQQISAVHQESLPARWGGEERKRAVPRGWCACVWGGGGNAMAHAVSAACPPARHPSCLGVVQLAHRTSPPFLSTCEHFCSQAGFSRAHVEAHAVQSLLSEPPPPPPRLQTGGQRSCVASSRPHITVVWVLDGNAVHGPRARPLVLVLVAPAAGTVLYCHSRVATCRP